VLSDENSYESNIEVRANDACNQFELNVSMYAGKQEVACQRAMHKVW